MPYIPLISPDKYRFCQEEIKHTSCRFFFFLKFFLFLKQIQAITTACIRKTPHHESRDPNQHSLTCTTKAAPKDGFDEQVQQLLFSNFKNIPLTVINSIPSGICLRSEANSRIPCIIHHLASLILVDINIISSI